MLLFFTVIPFAVGRLITYKAKSNLISEYLIGFFGNLGIFYILFAFYNWAQIWKTYTDPVIGAFTKLCRTYLIVIALLVVLWIFLDRVAIKKSFGILKTKLEKYFSAIKKDKFVFFYTIVFAIVFVVQIYFALGYEVNEWSYDDYDYVVSSKDTVSSDTLTYINFIDGSMPNIAEKRAATAWVTYIAFLSKVSSFEVTTVSHTILPVLLLMVAYLNFYYIAGILFDELDNRLIAMILTSMAYIFGLYSHYSATFRLLGALWQGKAILTTIAVPFLVVYLIEIYAKEVETRYMLPIAAISLGACSLTLLSAFFIAISSLIVWIIMCVYHRRIYGFRYLLASLVGPAFLGIFYTMLWMLQQDMKNNEYKYFEFRKYGK